MRRSEVHGIGKGEGGESHYGRSFIGVVSNEK